jgi:hypothetical protein
MAAGLPMPLTNERSIFSRVTGRRLRQARLEWPVPKSSVDRQPAGDGRARRRHDSPRVGFPVAATPRVTALRERCALDAWLSRPAPSLFDRPPSP